MKIRNGYVTNSSSTSFLISLKDSWKKEAFMSAVGADGESPMNSIFEDLFEAINNQKQEINKAVKDKLKIVFTTYIMVGLITHGIALFNKISFHDDTMETLLGASYTSGRWSIYIIDELRGFLFGTKFVSSPCFNGCVTLILFAFVTYILIEAFHISNRISLILI